MYGVKARLPLDLENEVNKADDGSLPDQLIDRIVDITTNRRHNHGWSGGAKEDGQGKHRSCPDSTEG